MIVVVSGPSGAGKTTLAMALAKHFNWDFQENSAGKIMKQELKDELRAMGKPIGLGQQGTINFAHTNPVGGKRFQESILESREELFENKLKTVSNGVYDRSSLDPIVFYLNQVVHNETQEESKSFINRCLMGMQYVDLVLRVPLQSPNKYVENNGSRVNNWYFQRKIDGLFDIALDLMHEYWPQHLKALEVERCPTWNWDKRLQWAIDAITSHPAYTNN